LDIPIEVFIGIPTIAGVAIGAWFTLANNWVGEKEKDLGKHNDDRQSFIHTQLMGLQQDFANLSKTIPEFEQNAAQKEMVWDSVEEMLDALGDIDTIGSVDDEVIRPLRAIRDWGVGLITSAALLSFVSALVYYEAPPVEQGVLFALVAVFGEFLFLIPAGRIQRNFKLYRGAIKLLSSNNLI
jgi:hypothetical protein